LDDAGKIDGVALTNKMPQMSTPKKAFLLSANEPKAEIKNKSIFDYESAF